MDSMDDKLKNIVSKIEKSNLAREDKDALYQIISRGLRRAGMGTLVLHMDQEKLKHLAGSLVENLTEDAYFDLMQQAISGTPAVSQAVGLMDEVLSGVDKVLADEGL